ncbi:MAG: hypothetical protein IT200_07820 [Thermoleophilia bacterium]|nr:hypothetical protein [Thermoleophilia bacterium]
MVDSKYPNRWFGSNPQAIPNHGKKLTPWDKELPKDWRSALGLGAEGESPQAQAAESTEDSAA